MMEYVNDKKDPSLLGKNASPEEIAAVQRMINNLVKDSCYEDTFKVVQKGSKVYIEHKGV